MGKQVDLSEGDPVVKDPPLHRLHDWMVKHGIGQVNMWAVVRLFVGWCGAATLLAFPLSGAVWNGSQDNAGVMLALGSILAFGMLMITVVCAWHVENNAIEVRSARSLVEEYVNNYSPAPAGNRLPNPTFVSLPQGTIWTGADGNPYRWSGNDWVKV